MKKTTLLLVFSIGWILIAGVSCSNLVITPYEDVYNCSVGDIGPAGGYVFYVNPDCDTDGWKYLEASALSYEALPLGSNTVDVEGTSRSIGTGLENTLKFIDQDSTTGTAPLFCISLEVTCNGIVFDDWFLPSRDELDELWYSIYRNGVVADPPSTANHYCSTQDSSDWSRGICREFYQSRVSFASKTTIGRIHAVRRF